MAKTQTRRKKRTPPPAQRSAASAEDLMFFPRLRKRAKWVFLFLALAFAFGFVGFGVGAGGSGIGDYFAELFNRVPSTGQPDVEDAQQKVKENPADAEAQLALANAYQVDGQTAGAITALTAYLVLKPEDTDLIAWLVQDHLSMSGTAQKQDIADPRVIAAFARKVGTQRRLAALYLLTVADIRGTSPNVWNAWKARLLEELFHATRLVLAGEAIPRSLADSVQARQVDAHRLLRLYAVPEQSENALWRHLDVPYFQRHTADEIAWHARHLYWRVDTASPIVKARLARDGAGLQVLVYLPDQKALFARICGFFGRAGLSILEAKIHTTRSGRALDTFAMHDPLNPNASYRETIASVEFELSRLLAGPPPLHPPPEGRISRQLKHFPLTPEVQIFPDDKGTHYILEVVAGDRPGLLARIA